jgi:xanthine dehydrogenase YagR molybdenum-binding subunit
VADQRSTLYGARHEEVTLDGGRITLKSDPGKNETFAAILRRHVDWRYGRIANANLADYRVPVNADIPELDVDALDIPDYQLDSVGARGIGEIGITGTGAAISNAIFHATGKRVRDLPVTPDKLV